MTWPDGKRRWPTVQFWRDPARPDLGLRFGLDFEQPTEGFPEIESYIPLAQHEAVLDQKRKEDVANWKRVADERNVARALLGELADELEGRAQAAKEHAIGLRGEAHEVAANAVELWADEILDALPKLRESP